MRKIAWSEDARADVRRIDRSTAMRIFTTIQRFAETGEGDVKGLKGESGELRLRVGDYRVRFTDEGDDRSEFTPCDIGARLTADRVLESPTLSQRARKDRAPGRRQ